MITEKTALELLEHEAIVPEAYKDSRGIWTWGVGVTDASGHKVGRYKDAPVSIERCLEVYLWLLKTKYLPPVLAAFKGRELTEAQLAGALSFHYNTGAIGRAGWVKQFLAGNLLAARHDMLLWTKNPELIPRRKAERDLFFDGKWTSDGKILVYPVRKPSYSPDWRHSQLVDIRPALREALSHE